MAAPGALRPASASSIVVTHDGGRRANRFLLAHMSERTRLRASVECLDATGVLVDLIDVERGERLVQEHELVPKVGEATYGRRGMCVVAQGQSNVHTRVARRVDIHRRMRNTLLLA